MIARDFKTNILPVSKKLFRFATHYLKDEDEAKDALQDIFLKLWQKKGMNLKKKDSLKTTTSRC